MSLLELYFPRYNRICHGPWGWTDPRPDMSMVVRRNVCS